MRKIVVIAVAVALAACGDKTHSTPVVAGEPNDTIAQAIPIAATSVTMGMIGSATDQDFFSFAVPAGGGILHAVTFDETAVTCAAGLTTTVDLYAVSGTLLATSGPGLAGCSELMRVLPEGRYAVDVHGSAPAYPARYALAMALVAPPASPVEHAVVPGSAASAAAFECAAIANATGAPVTVWLETYVGGVGSCTSGTAGQDDTVLRVLDPAGPVETSDDDSGILACSQLYYSLAAGATRYACVAAKPGKVVPSWDLLVDVGTEPNDSIPQATPIAPASTTAAWLASDLDHDYYSFTVADAGGGIFRATTFDGTGAACSPDVSATIDLYDTADPLLPIATTGAGAGCRDLMAFLPQGSYAVDVHGSPSAYQTPYTLVTSLAAPPTVPQPDGLVDGTPIDVTTDFACYAIESGNFGTTVLLQTYVGGAGSCTSATGQDDTVLRVLGPPGTATAFDDDGGVAPCSQIFYSLPAGATRYACVTAKPGQTLPSYQLYVDSDPEPNDTVAQATPILATSTTGARLGSATDHDFYSFTVPAGGGILRAMTFDGTGTGCSADLSTAIDLYDVANPATPIATSGAGLAGCSDLLRSLPAGSYAVDVHGASTAGYPAFYTLVTAVAPPPASSTLHALVQGSLPSTTAFECTAVANGTASPMSVWLETSVGGVGSCTSATAGQNDTVLRVLDPAGPIVASDDDGGVAPCSQLFHPLAAGETRYACVTPKPGQIVPSYQLFVDGDPEPNDTLAEATPIAATGTTLARFASSTDHDWFSFTVGSGGGIFRAMTFDGTGTACAASLSTVFELYDATNPAAPIATSGPGLGRCSELLAFLAPGSYAVDVVGTSTAGYPALYTLVTSLGAPVVPPSLETVLAGSIQSTTEFDCVAIANATAADLTIRLATSVGGFGSCTSATPGQNDTVLRVLDTAGVTVATSDDGGVPPCSQLYQIVPAGQTQYACVTAKPGAIVPSYDLLVAGGSEPNDTIATATRIQPSSETRGWLASAAGHDYYALDVPAGGGILRAMTFDETGTHCGLTLFASIDLYDSSGALVPTTDLGVPSCSDLLAYLPAGTYFLDVHDPFGQSTYPATYRLVTSVVPPPAPPYNGDVLLSDDIASATEFDCWTITNSGTASASVDLETFTSYTGTWPNGVGSCPGGPLLQNDTLLRVLDETGAVDAWDDDGGLDTCSLLLNYPLPAGATRYACVTTLEPWAVPLYYLQVDFH